jgi:hypothetical protein
MKQAMTSAALGFVFSLFILTEALSLTYYVRTDGSNGNSGLENSLQGAWASIQYAVDRAEPGDMVLVQAGMYPEVVTVTKPGLSASPITLKGAGDVHLLSLHFPGTDEFSRALTYNYVIDNFVFDGSLGASGHGIIMRGARRITNHHHELRVSEFPRFSWLRHSLYQ